MGRPGYDPALWLLATDFDAIEVMLKFRTGTGRRQQSHKLFLMAFVCRLERPPVRLLY
jgi:hypothetical protein